MKSSTSFSVPETTYQAARAVAQTIALHFARLVAAAQAGKGSKPGPVPQAAVIERIIDVAFWASLRREEGHAPKISLAFLPPGQAPQPLLFQQRLPLSPTVLTKLAPGVERPGIHLGVWHEDEVLYVWGTTRSMPSLTFVVDVSEPGLLVVKHCRLEGFGKFANVAVLKGDQVKVVDESSASLPDCPAVLSSLLGFASPDSRDDGANVLVQLAVSMRTHKRGGTLLVVPEGSSSWRQSIVHPIVYAVSPSFCGLADLMLQHEQQRKPREWQEKLRREVDTIAGLTAVDGATLISSAYELLAFGVKIGRPEGKTPVDKVLFTEPTLGASALVAHPTLSGGTRHLSAAQFVQDQPDALALVASQDGRFTIFAWSPCEQIVQAHRVDSLLL